MDTKVNGTKRRRTREDRRRTARACDRCRRLKERCEGGIPCTRCIHLGRHCEFQCLSSSQAQTMDGTLLADSPRQPEVNVQELLERVMYMEKIIKHKFEGIAFDLDNLRRVVRALDEDEQNNATSPTPPDEDPIEEEVCTINPVEDTTTHYSGEFSYWNFSMRVKRHIEDRMHPQDQVPVSNYWRAEQLHSGVSSVATAISSCPPRHIAQFLITIFFKHAETYYFCVDKAWLIENFNALYDDPEKFSRKSAAVVSIILTVLAIATQYAYLDSSSPSAGGTASEFSEDALGTMFYQQAIRLLPEIIEVSSLESVQACLLFAVYALPVDASGLGYIYITLANRLGMQNGMHRRYTGTGLTSTMVERRNCVWWTAYTVERKLSIFHGRPLSTHAFDVDAPLPSQREDVQNNGPVQTVPYMVASIQLTQRLEEFCHEMFLLRTCQKHERSGILSRLVSAKRALEQWWKELPDQVHTSVPHGQPHYRAAKHIQLEYCLVSMFIGRPLLLNGSLSRFTPSSPEGSQNTNISDSTAGPTTSRYTVSRQELVHFCVQAARDAIKLCRSLRDTGPGLARASYIEYSSCRASLLVLIAHSIQHQSSQYRVELREGLEMIREMAAAGDSARSEVALLESLERALHGLLQSSKRNGHHEHVDCADGLGSDYECFKHWESLWKNGDAGQHTETSAETSTHHGSMATSDHSQLEVNYSGSSQQPFMLSNSYPGHTVSQSGKHDHTLGASSAFETDPLPFGSSNGYTHPEFRVLQEFLEIPGYRFDTGFEAEIGLALDGTPFQG